MGSSFGTRAEPPAPSFRVRPYRAGDREAVREICWQAAGTDPFTARTYEDRESWVEIYTSYYTDQEPESCFVAVSAAEPERVLGYLLGCVDTRKVQSEFQIALRHNVTRFLWARPGTAGFWWRAGWDALRESLGSGKPAIDLDRYPAHMHCNLLPDARSRGVGFALFEAFHGYLRTRGVPGAHGEAYAANLAIHGLLSKLGYRKFGAPFPVPGVRTPEGQRQLGQVVTIDLTARTPRAAESSAQTNGSEKGV
jgi:GNAT superfamily N-acetyltransferase